MVTYLKASDSRAFGGPGKYIQGPGELDQLAEHSKEFGGKPFIIIDPFFFKDYSIIFPELYGKIGQSCTCAEFRGESSMAEITRLTSSGASAETDVVIAMGGGKTLDTGKTVAINLDVPMLLIPTAASSDAPCSRITAVYNEDGSVYPLMHKRNPELVLVDTNIILHSPPRMFSAGIGDALATWLEARTGWESGAVNGVGKGYRISKAGMAVAKACFDILMAEGAEAYRALKAGCRTQSFEDVVEANILLSGIGFENTACSVAHGFQASASGAVPEMHHCMHGEKVSFGILVQLVMENRPIEEINSIADFLISVDLPVMLADLGLTEGVAEKMRRLVRYGIENKALMHVEPFTVTEDSLYHAVMYADQLGCRRKAADAGK